MFWGLNPQNLSEKVPIKYLNTGREKSHSTEKSFFLLDFDLL